MGETPENNEANGEVAACEDTKTQTSQENTPEKNV